MVEYTIIVGIGAIFIPLMLFDGTKDIPKKLVPVFISFMVKIIVITVCIMFVYYQMLESCIHNIADDGGMNFLKVGEIFFEAALAYILTQNAPQIAQTILTGQPQLSMKEALQGVGTAGATAMGMGKTGVAAARGGVKAGVNAAGTVQRAAGMAQHAGAVASHDTRTALRKAGVSGEALDKASQGAGRAAGIRAFASGMLAKPTKDLVERIQAKGNDFVHGKTRFNIPGKVFDKGGWNGANGTGTGGGGAAASAGANPHVNPNGDVGTARDATGKNMTVGGFMEARKLEGMTDAAADAIGKRGAADAIKRYERGQGEALPDSLSGNERAFEK